MACNSCSKKSVPKPLSEEQMAAQSQVRALAGDNSGDGGDLILVEYVGGKQGAMNYKGPSGQVYRFGATPGESQKLMKPQDAAHFTARTDFRLINKDAPVGVASS